MSASAQSMQLLVNLIKNLMAGVPGFSVAAHYLWNRLPEFINNASSIDILNVN